MESPMPVRSLLVGLCALLWLGPAAVGAGTLNVPTDADGNGLPDSVYVGDFDADGVLEMDDLQDAMDALTDPGEKRITVAAGSFEAPANPGSRPGRTHALLELQSFTTLECAGPELTVLRAGPLTAGNDWAVVANDDHTGGNAEVWIRSCQIDGGAPSSYASAGVAKSRRMGVFFRRTRGSGVTDSWVHGTVHTGLYTSNSQGDRFLRNLVEDAGGYGDTSGGWRQPCIYLFAFGGGVELRDFEASDNTLRRCGHSGLNTRAEHIDAPGDVVRNLSWERNTVEDTHSACIALRGVERATVRELTCQRTGAVQLSRDFGTGYRFEGNDNANSDVLIEDVVVTEVSGSPTALDVGAWVDGLSVRRLRVEGAPERDCAWVQRPLRNAVLEDVTLRDCGRAGMVVRSVPGGRDDASETLTLRRVEVDQVDRDAPLDTGFRAGIDFEGDHARLLLEDLALAGASAPELRFGGALTRSTLRRVEVDSVDPGWLGAFPEALAPECTPELAGGWITSLDGIGATDCVFAAGTAGSTPARCGCDGAVWSPIYWDASPGIEFAGGAAHERVRLKDVAVKNARGVAGVGVGGTPSKFTVQTLLGADDSAATDVDQRSAIDFEAADGFSVKKASCAGTQAGAPCVE